MKVLHRTPLHHRLLSEVNAGHIEWRANVGAFGRFAYKRGKEITDPDSCICMYELWNSELIEVSDPVVAVTSAGSRRLGEWSVAR
jgi:hypothetical protein